MKQREALISARNILRIPAYLINGIKYHAAGHWYTPKPIYATLHLTHRCNSRCTMCRDWKTKKDSNELRIPEIRDIFHNPIFKSVKKFVLSGGEPTLREDMAEIVEIILDSCPQIEEIALITNGLEPGRVLSRVNELLALPKIRKSGILTVQVSLDGYGNVHENIRRVPQAFDRAVETITKLKDLQCEVPFYLCLTCVVQPLNIENLIQLAEFGQETGLPINFVPVDLRNLIANQPEQNMNENNLPSLTAAHIEKLKVLFTQQLTPYLKPANIPFWQEYFKIVNGQKRRLPCFLLHYYVGIDSNGTLYACCRDIPSLAYGNILDESPDSIWYSDKARDIRKMVKKQFCSTCSCCCDTAFSFRLEFFYYAWFLIKKMIRGSQNNSLNL